MKPLGFSNNNNSNKLQLQFYVGPRPPAGSRNWCCLAVNKLQRPLSTLRLHKPALNLYYGIIHYFNPPFPQALDLISDWTQAERSRLRHEAPLHGLRTEWRGGTLQHLAQQALAVASGGLQRRGKGEERFLQELHVRPGCVFFSAAMLPTKTGLFHLGLATWVSGLSWVID